MGLGRKVLYDYRDRYPSFGTPSRNRRCSNSPPLDCKPLGPDAATIARIQDATALVAAGLTLQETADRLGVKLATVRYWQSDQPATWKQELDRAMRTAMIVIRRQAGTDAVMDDPRATFAAPLLARSGPAARGKSCFPLQAGRPSLASFRITICRPGYTMRGAGTIENFRELLSRWRLFTGDPPLEEITVATLAHFRDCLEKMRGRDRISRLSPQTVAQLPYPLGMPPPQGRAPGYRNRDGAGLLASVPWIKKPPAEEKPVSPRNLTAEELNALYLAAVAMELPKIDGFKAPAWSRALSCCDAEHGPSPPDPL